MTPIEVLALVLGVIGGLLVVILFLVYRLHVKVNFISLVVLRLEKLRWDALQAEKSKQASDDFKSGH